MVWYKPEWLFGATPVPPTAPASEVAPELGQASPAPEGGRKRKTKTRKGGRKGKSTRSRTGKKSSRS